ncbi:hypothetical protein [Streptomyces spiramenti]|uniref:Lipoprotein n=1 Tax=Streptomyces spiramenti TaxID=2720606 RepID=A0ABX1AHT1_9ACTN|nr:hypothetical protein [Streptomyces spiramenti]NJP65476.1 hypothetical protein [Streptomyces spiramenti]
MNRRPRHAHRRTTTALAAVAAAGLLLSACGSDAADEEIAGVDRGETRDDDAANDEPDTDADDGDETDAPAEDAVDRPDIQVADSLEMVFEEPDTGDPEHDAILTDSQWQIKSVFEVLTTHDLENSSVGFYTTGESYMQDMEALEFLVSEGRTSEGEMRFYKHRVTESDGSVAFVEYCRDFSQVVGTYFETGETRSEANPDAEATYYKARLQVNDLGVWQTTDTEIEESSSKC